MSRLEDGIRHLVLYFLYKKAFNQRETDEDLLNIFEEIEKRKRPINFVRMRLEEDNEIDFYGPISLNVNHFRSIYWIIRDMLVYDVGYLHRYIENFHFESKMIIYVQTENRTRTTPINHSFKTSIIVRKQPNSGDFYISEINGEPNCHIEKTHYTLYSGPYLPEGEFIWFIPEIPEIEDQCLYNFASHVIAKKIDGNNLEPRHHMTRRTIFYRWCCLEELFENIIIEASFDHAFLEKVLSIRYHEDAVFYYEKERANIRPIKYIVGINKILLKEDEDVCVKKVDFYSHEDTDVILQFRTKKPL